MPELTTRQRFERGQASATKIEAVAQEVLAELADPSSEAARSAMSAGLDLADLADARAEVNEIAHGVDPFVTPIVVGIAVSAGSKVAETLWKEVLWPRIRRRLGADALGEASAPPEEL